MLSCGEARVCARVMVTIQNQQELWQKNVLRNSLKFLRLECDDTIKSKLTPVPRTLRISVIIVALSSTINIKGNEV